MTTLKEKSLLLLTIYAWSVTLNAVCGMQIMSSVRPDPRISEHIDTAIGTHREEHGLPKDIQFLFVFEVILICLDLIITLSKRPKCCHQFLNKVIFFAI